MSSIYVSPSTPYVAPMEYRTTSVSYVPRTYQYTTYVPQYTIAATPVVYGYATQSRPVHCCPARCLAGIIVGVAECVSGTVELLGTALGACCRSLANPHPSKRSQTTS